MAASMDEFPTDQNTFQRPISTLLFVPLLARNVWSAEEYDPACAIEDFPKMSFRWLSSRYKAYVRYSLDFGYQ